MSPHTQQDDTQPVMSEQDPQEGEEDAPPEACSMHHSYSQNVA